jgi:hypothetical protein
MDKTERWAKIAAAVGGKSRYKFLKEFVAQKKKFEKEAAMEA